MCRKDAAGAAIGFCLPFVQGMPKFEPKIFDFVGALAGFYQLVTLKPAVRILNPNVDHLVRSLLTMAEFPNGVVEPRRIDV